MSVVRAVTDLGELRAAHRDLLRPSFRPGELLPEEEFLAQFADRASAIGESDDSGALTGLAVVEDFGAAALLQYLVVSPRVRGGGTGSRLLEAVLAEGRSEERLMIAEFDRPDAHPVHPLHGDPAARLRFYARFGALALDLPYFQAPVSETAEREHGMLLAVFDPDGAITERGRLTDAQSAAVAGFLHASTGDADDPAALRLIAMAEVLGGIPVRTLDRYEEVPRSSG